MNNINAQRNKRYNDFFENDIKDFDITTTEALVWCCAFGHTNWNTGTFTLSYSRIAKQCNCAELTAKRALKTLHDKQLIRRVKQGSGTASSVYALLDNQGELMPQTEGVLTDEDTHQ